MSAIFCPPPAGGLLLHVPTCALTLARLMECTTLLHVFNSRLHHLYYSALPIACTSSFYTALYSLPAGRTINVCGHLLDLRHTVSPVTFGTALSIAPTPTCLVLISLNLRPATLVASRILDVPSSTDSDALPFPPRR